jgi:hypothetical protein
MKEKIQLLIKEYDKRLWELNNSKNNYDDKEARAYFEGRMDSYREVINNLEGLLK